MSAQTAGTTRIIAVSSSDAQKYGCPYCGGIYGSSPISGNGSQIWNCSDCGETSINLADGVTKSTIGAGDYYPEISVHPRSGQPVDRERLIRERKENIESEAFFDLQKWLLLGYGHPVRVTKVGEHSSKSRGLPIVASESSDNVAVTWFGNNYHFYFLGVKLKREIPAVFLRPISTMFGDYALSGHVNTKIAPPIKNFEKAYHNLTPLKIFGGDCGNGTMAALTIRYLEEISKLDIDGLLDVCFRKTRYGAVDNIDGEYIEFADLAKLLDLEYDKFAYYDFDVQNAPKDVFDRVNVDWFDSDLGRGKSSVHVTMKEGVFLPALPLPSEIYVDLKDTPLNQYIPDAAQEQPVKNCYSKHVLYKVPVKLLGWRECPILDPAHWVYGKVNDETREFTFLTDNVLDCALTAFFFTKVLAPVLKKIMAR
jgi:ribosomal protein L37AE/L43A